MSRKNKSFSIIEVLIFLMIINLIFISLSTITTHSIKKNKENESRILASYYAEELKEWLYSEKEKDWFGFLNQINFDGEIKKNYCFNQLSWNNNGFCDSFSLANNFKREATFFKLPDEKIKIEINVYWKQGMKDLNIFLPTIFSSWE